MNKEFVLFLDESGNHDLSKVNLEFPVFCLCGCVFEREYYNQIAKIEIDKIKIKYWNNTDVIFHSREIRKHEKEFIILNDPEIRKSFYKDIDKLILDLDFFVIAVVIQIQEHINKYGANAYHPYSMSFEFILERYSLFLRENSGYITAESRGKKENKTLQAIYKKLHNCGSYYIPPLKNVTSFGTKKKKENINGLQISDLVAYPIARRVIDKTDENQSFEVVKHKFLSRMISGKKSIIGCGIKIFPNQENFNGLL